MPDPYAGLLKKSPYYMKSDLAARVVAVLDTKLDNRGLSLITQASRAIPAGQIHELVATEEESAAPGKTVNQAVYMAFVEFLTGGVVLSGDSVLLGEKEIGKLAGFDETHFPNHLNIIVKCPRAFTGRELQLRPGDVIRFKFNPSAET
ncbi:MAG TPA: hypothetical protein GXX40_03110 [Firmicutes bacterium]|nr:hypothetical protein [Bacillota bacterium]